jgi:polyhydroxyalkanoate synthase
MTTFDKNTPPAHLPDPLEFSHKLSDIAMRSQHLVTEFLGRQQNIVPNFSMSDPLNIGQAFFEMTTRMMADPTKLFQAQMSLWQDYLNLWHTTTMKFLGEETQPIISAESGDRRFNDPAWQESVVFDYIKQSYLLSARWMQGVVKDVEGLDEKTARKVDFYTRQLVDAMSPSNFVYTNPEVLRKTMETGGENLIKGLENLLEDLERGHGQLKISMTDYDAFKVGENIAITPGKVIYQNDLMQLIQYEPTTKDVLKTPLVIIPPWINKYYILDLTPKNSFIKWAVEQGHSVFLISWVNPDESLGHKTFEDYMLEGPLDAITQVEKVTGEKQVNMIGYCLGGTLLACLLAYMQAKKDNRVKSATYFTTMVDFADSGELSVFIDEEQIVALEARMNEKGYLEGSAMATTFNMLRANDLIWSFVVNNYLLGKEPFPFDLLYWNSDATRMPAKMHSFYLRKMYQENLLVQKGGITIDGVPIDLTTIKTPSFLLSTAQDHIAPWKSTYVATQIYKGPVKFVLSGSGHIAGVINPPEKKKYGYWENDKNVADADAWLKAAKQHEGSWWPVWHKWVSDFSEGTVPALKIGGGKLKPLEDAPGSYVKVRYS